MGAMFYKESSYLLYNEDPDIKEWIPRVQIIETKEERVKSSDIEEHEETHCFFSDIRKDTKEKANFYAKEKIIKKYPHAKHIDQQETTDFNK